VDKEDAGREIQDRIPIPNNKDMAIIGRIPNVKSMYHHRQLTFLARTLKNNNLAAKVITHKFEGELQTPKFGIKKQAKDKDLRKSFANAYDSLEQRYHELREIVMSHQEANHAELIQILLENGFCEIEKIIGKASGRDFTPPPIDVNFFVQNPSFNEDWMTNVQHNDIWKALAQVMLDSRVLNDEEEKLKLEPCPYCGKPVKGSNGLTAHFTSTDNHLKVLKEQKVVRETELSCLDKSVEAKKDGTIYTLEQCPWGVDRCVMHPDRWKCIRCRRLHNVDPRDNKSSIASAKNERVSRKSYLSRTNQEMIPHQPKPGSDLYGCTNRKKIKSCERPDTDGWWCKHCVDETGIVPKKVVLQREKAKNRKETAKRGPKAQVQPPANVMGDPDACAVFNLVVVGVEDKKLKPKPKPKPKLKPKPKPKAKVQGKPTRNLRGNPKGVEHLLEQFPNIFQMETSGRSDEENSEEDPFAESTDAPFGTQPELDYDRIMGNHLSSSSSSRKAAEEKDIEIPRDFLADDPMEVDNEGSYWHQADEEAGLSGRG